MAAGDAVAAEEHIVRYARPTDIDNGLLNGSAFNRPEKDHDGLSVCRLGQFAQEKVEDLRRLRDVMSAWRTLRRNGRLAELSVTDVIEVGRQVRELLEVVEDGLAAEAAQAAEDGRPARAAKPANPAHALILGLPFEGGAVGSLSSELAGDLLRRRVGDRLHPAIND